MFQLEEQTKLEEIKEYITDKFLSIKRFFLSVKRGVSNILYYGKTIWEDRDWDYGYSNTLFLLKLKKTYKYFSNPNNVSMMEERRQFILKYMKLSIYFLECIIEEDFKEEADKAIYSTLKYAFVDIGDGPHKGMSEMKKMSGPSDRELDDIHKREKIRAEKIKTLYYKILKTRSEYWWD